MYYSLLVDYYTKLNATSSRLEKTKILADLFKKTNKNLLQQIILLVQGQVFPVWNNKVLGISEKLVIKSMASSSGVETNEINNLWKTLGDLGEVSEKVFENKKQNTLFSKRLTIDLVFNNLKKLTLIEGISSTDKKLQLISELLINASANEAKYVVRTVLGDLRIGIGDGTLRDAIVEAFFEKTKENIDLVQRAYDLTSDFSEVAKIAVKGKSELKKLKLRLFRPLKVMLAIKAEDAKAALNAVNGEAMLEPKFDGFRVQCHKKGDEIRIYTRSLDDVSKQFPDIIQSIKENIKEKTVILDGEAVGYDVKTKKYLPFQNISQRIKRKHNIELIRKKLPVELNLFDILFLNGKSLINKSFLERRKLLESLIKNMPGKIQISKGEIINSVKKANQFYLNALKEGFEGAMVKKLDAVYKPGARVGHMIKLKGVMETLDLVITGGEWGTGKRKGWITSLNISCKNKERFLEIGKVGTGLKEKREEGLSFAEVTDLLKNNIITEIGRMVKFKPNVIIEIAYEEIQKSPSYNSGYALRFPRVVRLRSDKSLEDVSNMVLVENLYLSQ